ncbi:hypothetical protein ZWY2020_004063 [Hordeum vulgare]|nr:hypothetical protein ZWY2020_004063 [Hordeum vulgare]
MFCSPPHVLLAASPRSSSLLIDVCGSMAAFMEEEMAVDDVLGYPKAYARLCRAGTRGGALCLPYTHGSPGAFLPYVLQTHEVPTCFFSHRSACPASTLGVDLIWCVHAMRAKDVNEMFPVVDA